ncbi:MAG: hypothetical protein R3245_01215 [Kiloniellales bacterium]|nr:hypothetical protein [Kiloniellales bacterium]
MVDLAPSVLVNSQARLSTLPEVRQQPVRQPRQEVNHPDPPDSERSRASVEISSRERIEAAQGGLLTPSASQPNPGEGFKPVALVGNSGLTTYRDQESGRVIIRVFDKESGDILLELPPEEHRERPNTASLLRGSLASSQIEV